MLLKAVILFLAAMGLLAIFGKRKATPKKKPPAKRVETAEKCPECGAYRIGTGDCACGKS